MDDSRTLLRQALSGQPVDRIPFSLWRHFPDADAAAATLAQRTIDFWQRHDLDFVKLTPTGMFQAVDYGASIALRPDDIGTTQLRVSPVRTAADWRRLPAVSAEFGALGMATEAVELVRRALPESVPVLQTLFSPSTTAGKLAHGGLVTLVGEGPALSSAVLDRLADDAIGFARACLSRGCDGFFFASQYANGVSLPTGDYEELCLEFDLRVLQAIRQDSEFLLLHLHGIAPLIEIADQCPVDGVSWEISSGGPTMRQVMGRTTKGLVGGITRRGPVLSGDADRVRNEIDAAIADTRGRRLVIAPECVLPRGADDAALRLIGELAHQPLSARPGSDGGSRAEASD